jgi:hypothetical protein
MKLRARREETPDGNRWSMGILAGGGRQPVQGGEDLLRFAQIVDQVVDELVDEGAGAHCPTDPVEPLMVRSASRGSRSPGRGSAAGKEGGVGDVHLLAGAPRGTAADGVLRGDLRVGQPRGTA